MDWQKIANDLLKTGTKRRGASRARKPWWWGIVALIIAGGSYVVKQYSRPPANSPVLESPSGSSPRADGDSLQSAIREKRSDVPVEGGGEIVRALPDDTEGDRHQRFIVRLSTGSTILIAHNIDLARRAPVATGQSVRFKGEYVWNQQGGLVHWTHHDPAGKHADGWIELNGTRYE